MSNDSLWTPAPWFVQDEPVGGGYRIDAEAVRGIATATQRDPHPLNGGAIPWQAAEANAYLIAAAPDLYEALDQAVTSMQDSGYPNSHVSVRAACAALAKARGDQ